MQSLGVALLLLLVFAGLWIYRGIRMPGASYRGDHRTLAAEAADLSGRLRNHVEYLARALGERNTRRPGSLEQSADYIEAQFSAIGYPVRRQIYAIGRDATLCANLEVEIPGVATPEQIVLLGAHYDTVPGSPGADDNASGVAALIEIGRSLHGRRPDKTMRLVAFVKE
jgi:acetylornithine deacetylase/succinyl-diaminopimelate desuccinylase-like protein